MLGICDLLTIAAKQRHLIAVFYCGELCLYRLVVGHAFRVLAFRDPYDLSRHDKLLLFHHLEVADDVHCRFRSYQSKLAQLLVLEELVGNLDDAFLSVDLAGKVDAYCDLAFHPLEVEDVQCLIYIFRRNMVQNGTVFQCAYYQFFSSHNYLYPNKYEIIAILT